MSDADHDPRYIVIDDEPVKLSGKLELTPFDRAIRTLKQALVATAAMLAAVLVALPAAGVEVPPAVAWVVVASNIAVVAVSAFQNAWDHAKLNP